MTRFAGVLAAVLGLAACAALPPRESAAPSPEGFWVPPGAPGAGAGPPRTLTPVPEFLRDKVWTLADVLEVTLRNHPATRGAWADARAAAANVDVQRAPYFPKVSLDAAVTSKATHDTRYDSSWRQANYGPALGLSWLLLDGGARAAAWQGASEGLLAAHWTQNAVLQDTILATEKAYFGYLAAKAAAEARRANLEDAELQREGAVRRRDAGVATLADVLQARTAAAQAKLALQAALGTVQTTRGALAAAMGLSAQLSFDVADVPKEIPVEAVQQDVEALLGEALARRPALAAAKAAARAAQAQVRQAEADGLPTVSLAGAWGSTRFDYGAGAPAGSDDHREDVASAALLLRFPLFTGFAQTAAVEKTRAQADASLEKVRGLEQQILLQVFTAYYGLKTASERVVTVRELLASATQSEQVARARYAEGVGTAVEVLTAQAALADARALGVQAHWEWYTNLAQLAHDTGLLGLHGESPLAPLPPDAVSPAR